MDQKFFDVPFALGGDQSVVPDATQPDGSVSFMEGFGFDYQRDLATDPLAKPVDRSVTNYLFNAITAAIAALQKTGIPEWITPAQNGGVALAYAKYAKVRYSATIPATTFETYVSTVDGNTSVPGADANWQPVADFVASAADILAGTSNRTIVTPLQLKVALVASAPAVGGTSNLTAALGVPGASLTVNDDEIIVATALGGSKFVLGLFSKTVNLSVTGVGGMDTGSAPLSGYVAIYAIYNPTTQTAALLAQDATSAVRGTVYSGSNMPAGYTASALVSVWPTNGSGQLVAGLQIGREVAISNNTVLNTSTPRASLTSFSVASAVPLNAHKCRGDFTISASSATAGANGVVCGSGVEIGRAAISATSATAGASTTESFPNIPIAIAQTLFYRANVSSGSLLFTVNITAYTI